MNSLLYLGLGGVIAAGGAGLQLAAHGGPAPRPAVEAAAAPEAPITSVDDVGHVYPRAARLLVPDGYGIVCVYTGSRLTDQGRGRDGSWVDCPAAPPAQDVTWNAGGEAQSLVDLADPDVPACRRAGGTPRPPQLGGGGGPGAPVDFCMIGGHLWGPGGPAGEPWITTVVSGVECRLLGGTYRDAADPDLAPQQFNCVLG